MGRAALNVLLAVLGALVALVGMRLLGVGLQGSLVWSAVGVACGTALSEYRSSPGSVARQRANRERHRLASPLWQKDEDDRPDHR